MKISVLGLGWFGYPLAQALQLEGHEVLGTTRTQSKLESLKIENLEPSLLNYPDLPQEDLLNSDIVILNIPPFEDELAWFKSWKWNKSSWIIFISSISVSPLLKDQEDWIKENFSSWTVLRFGGLIGNGRHPGKHLSGKKNLPGRLWPVNLVHLDDCIEVTKAVIEKKILHETFNVVSDEHPTREEFYNDFCRKAGLPLPEFDQTDISHKEAVSAEKILKIYPSFRPL